MKSYAKLVHADTFMGRYMRFMDAQETAYAYDFWSALWAVSSVCSRLTYVARPRAPIYLNMYTVLIGESGVPRKTTSVNMASRLVRDALIRERTVGFIDAKMTPEKLDDILHERTLEHGCAELCVAIPELAVFLGTERYVATMPTLLTDLYDCPSHRHGGGTIARGECIQRNVWLSFLSASTPVWLLKTVNPNVVEGGFTSRCMFINTNLPKHRIAWPSDSDVDAERAELLQDLRDIRTQAKTSEPIRLTDAGMSAFTKWYNKRAHSYEIFKQSFEAREDSHVLRVAALLCINDGTWVIDAPHIRVAVELVTTVKVTSATLFEGGEHRTKYATALDCVRSTLVSAGMDPVPRSTLFRKSRRGLTTEELEDLLRILHEVGAVQHFVAPHENGLGRPAQYYRGTQLLLARGLGDQVLERFSL